MADFNKLIIPISTPEAIWNIDLQAVTEAHGGPIGVVADVEGTLVEYGDDVVDPRAVEWVAENAENDSLGWFGLNTNKANSARLCSRVLTQLSVTLPRPMAYEYPVRRSSRKPSGNMGRTLLIKARRQSAFISPPVGFVMVGDKPSDMFEADATNRLIRENNPEAAIIVHGFMVARLGTADHLLDRFGIPGRPSIRTKATAFREEARIANPVQQFVKAS